MAQNEIATHETSIALSPFPPPTAKPSMESFTSTLAPSGPNPPAITHPKELDDDYASTSQNPFSAFYLHPTTRTSFEQIQSSKTHIAIYQHDLEAGSGLTQVSTHALKITNTEKADERVWPDKKNWIQKSIARKARQSQCCAPWRRLREKLSKKQRLGLKIMVAIVLVAAITGLGVGISKAVGGGVFRSSDNQNSPIKR